MVSDQLTPLERVLQRLEGYSTRRNEYRARCPQHNGQSDDSLSVRETQAGTVVLTCHGGCDREDVVHALGLEWKDLFPDNGRPPQKFKKPKRKSKGKLRTLTSEQLPQGTYYQFTTPADKVLKRQRHKREWYIPAGEGLWKTGPGVLDGVPDVPYRLPELLEGVRAGETIYHLEGPKDVETAHQRLGVVATTSGSTSSWRAEFRAHYTGADVVIVPDNDDPSREYADTVARSVGQVAMSVKVVSLPGLPEGGDLTDWLEAGHTKDEFFQIVDEAPVYDPEQERPWGQPRELDTALPPVADLKKHMLPDYLAEWVFDSAERLERVAPDFVGADAVVALAAMIGRKVAIRPKQHDDWTVVPNLWGATVGRPATMKTPAQRTALKPLRRLSVKATEEYQKAEEEWKSVTRKIDAAEQKALEDQLKSVAKKATDKDNPNRTEVDKVAEKLRNLEPEPEPVHKRYDTNDSTIEKLTVLLRDNPNGLLLHRDELMGWLRTLDRAGHENDRGFFLETWNGDNSYTSDRIERGFTYAPAVCLSILGGIQPGPLKTYVAEALSDSEKADGLLQRFQVLVWPDMRPYRRVDRPPNLAAQEKANAVFKALDDFDAEAFGASMIDDEIPFVRFAPKAQAIFDAWRDEFEPEYLEEGYPEALEAHFDKYRSLFASLALIFEVVAYAEGESEGQAVSDKSALRAAAWCEYLSSHAKRLYHPALIAPTMAASALLEKIEEGAITHQMKLRKIVDKDWSGLDTTDTVREAIAVLEDHGWVRLERVKPPGGGRPSEELYIHPDLRGDG